MGTEVSKINDKDQEKIYRQISLLEARRQFSLIDRKDDDAPKIMSQCPISRNFYIESVKFDQGNLWYIFESKCEINGESRTNGIMFGNIVNLVNLNFILTTCFVNSIKENYFVGLSKDQYDFLFNR
jgi:hypothetical protein